jgi:beta-glucosidase-like glycosyl hydrolase
MMNMMRLPQAGRNWEGFGADPFLTGEAAYETILGMQVSFGFVLVTIRKLIYY